jgi:CubicO group peptidase (beta-lactamase class C family)
MRDLGPRSMTVTRRQVLAGGAVAAAGLALRPVRSLAVGAPAENLAPPRDLESFVLDRLRAGRLPGVSTAIVRDGQLWSRGFGEANLPRDRHVDSGTIFMLASISKTVICTAVMQAVEDGLFALDDDVDDVLPFSVRIPGFPNRKITARQLLTHTSSIRDRWPVWDDLYSQGDSPIGLGEFLEGYLVPGGEDYREGNFYGFAPGKAYRYSNVGASLAAYLVEAASGTGFDVWCNDRIFEPLAMTRTGWHLADVSRSEVAMPYRWSANLDTYVPYGHYGYPDYPDGALRTTARHLCHHMGMVMNGGEWNGVRLLSTESVREILRLQIPDIVRFQGLIWYRFHFHGRTLVGHNGGDQGVATVAFFDPDTGIGVAVLGNGNWRQDGNRWPLQEIMQRLFEDAPQLLDGSAS